MDKEIFKTIFKGLLDGKPHSQIEHDVNTTHKPQNGDNYKPGNTTTKHEINQVEKYIEDISKNL